MTVFIVFGGYYANTSNVPKGLRWIAHTSLIKYAFEAFCVNEFKGLTFVNDKPGRVRSESGEEVRSSPASSHFFESEFESERLNTHMHAFHMSVPSVGAALEAFRLLAKTCSFL